MRNRSLALLLLAAAVTLGSAALASACSSDSGEAAPSRPVTPVTPDTDGSVDAAADGGEAGVDAACTGPDNCFSCEPVVNLDYLNECTDDQCTPFDNVARLPLYKPGQPLPAIP